MSLPPPLVVDPVRKKLVRALVWARLRLAGKVVARLVLARTACPKRLSVVFCRLALLDEKPGTGAEGWVRLRARPVCKKGRMSVSYQKREAK